MGSAPIATYRLQFNSELTFERAAELVPYLRNLGISHCYASPIFAAKPGSQHGYDIVDPSRLNPEIGSLEQFQNFVKILRQQNMGLILDIVPNHMYIFDPANSWWWDLLENGEASFYADCFDIDWYPPKAYSHHKVLLPILEDQYGKTLENQKIGVSFKNGAFQIELSGLTLPTDPKSWNLILEPLSQEVQKIFPKDTLLYAELKGILEKIKGIPSTEERERIGERIKEIEKLKAELASLFEKHSKLAELVETHLMVMGGKKGDARSFDLLDRFLDAQAYRLCFWRVANDEINYRRFFDIFEYAGIRIENQKVFEAVHGLVAKFVHEGLVDGLRIDHIDGLWDPEEYLIELRKLGPKAYVIAEKILTGNEKLQTEWPLQGTVGYDFLNQLNAVFIYQPGGKNLVDFYRKFATLQENSASILYQCKKLVLNVSLASELNVLSRHLERIAEAHRSSQDFTNSGLKEALSDVIASFPVYRSYITAAKIHEEDRQMVTTACFRAKRRNSTVNASLFDFIQSVLLLQHPEGATDKKQREEFVMRFQQLTGPVMAKGLEDTAFYRYTPLSSLNEVGGDPFSFGINLETFHRKNLERWEFWPMSLLASSTHDTKRSEDVRARLNILSEIPLEWEKAVEQWSEQNQSYKIADGEEWTPSPNEEYLLYQTLVGSWPLKEMDTKEHNDYVVRIQNYMEKAVKEAKVYSSWINPDAKRDSDVRQFVEKILDPKNAFMAAFTEFTNRISQLGMLNSLSQTLLKLTCPGIPDIYQGNELWDFSLVDPDNRRPVDFEKRIALLQNLENFQELLKTAEDGRIKLTVIQKTLQLRQKFPDLFVKGLYLPLEVQGPLHNHVIAFARIQDEKVALTIVGRFFTFFMKDFSTKKSLHIWQDTFLQLPPELEKKTFSNIFTHSQHEGARLSLADVFKNLPCALLESIPTR